MKRINNYEQFCKAFESEDKELKEEAKLLLFIQNWIIRILDYLEEDSLDYSLNKLLDKNTVENIESFRLKDSLSNIVDDSVLAFRYLSENMREKIIRENVKMPVYKVREINSYGLNWLSRQSGKTIRQKISSAGNSVMAVKRRMSLDTAENRLFISFAKEIYETLNTKLGYLGKLDTIQTDEEEAMRDELAGFLRGESIEEVKRWENLPPNNTLLSDRNYKKIWYAWNKLNRIDNRINNDSVYLENRLVTIFFIELLISLRDFLLIPQEPIEIDYDDFKVHIFDKPLLCLDKCGNTVEINEEKDVIILKKLKKEIEIKFISNDIVIQVNRGEEKKYEFIQDKIDEYIMLIVTELDLKILKPNNTLIKNKLQIFKSVVVDLFSLHPEYIGDDNIYKKLPERILQQKYYSDDIDGEKREFYLPCDKSNAIKLIPGITDTYTIPFAVDNGSMEQMKRLVYMMENYISTNSFTYIFPDAYNELQLSMIHKAARMVYRKVRNIPVSIGAAFKFQMKELFRKNFKVGDSLLIINLIDNEVTFTLVTGVYDENINNNISDYNGIVWERHPTSTVLFKEEIDRKILDLLTKLGCIESEKVYKLLGLDGLRDEVDNLSILFGNEWFQITPEIRQIINQFKLNITNAVENFLIKNKNIVRSGKVHLISLINSFIYKGSNPFYTFDKQDILAGCKELEHLEGLTDIPLWHDHLPSLSIKLMCGKFDLIKNARVVPKFDEKQIIPINGIFTLPKKCDEYHFNLVQDENARKIKYEAVIRNSAFPLSHDVECNLLMTYKYGTEEPYELIFVPQAAKTADFLEAKVKWSQINNYDIKGLKAPDFPSKLSWEELQRYPSKNGDTINVLEILKDNFELLNKGFYTTNTSGTFMRKHKDGTQFGKFIVRKDNDDIVVNWSQKAWDKNSLVPQTISEISYWLVPYPNFNNKRYRIENLWDARTKSNKLWFKNTNNCYMCIVNFDYDGVMTKVAISEDQFDRPDMFHTSINDVTFEIMELNNGNLLAKNVHDENGGELLKQFRAVNICEWGEIPSPPDYFINTFHEVWIRTLFANNRLLNETGCPVDFQRIFGETVKNLIKLFYEFKEINDKKKLVALLSLAASDIGKDYYDIAYELLEMYQSGIVEIPFDIGCAFGDLSTDIQKKFMEFTLNEVTDDYVAIGILSKALWHNEQFVYNADFDILLNVYLPKAIDCVGNIMKYSKKRMDSRFVKRKLQYCLEYILGVLRLRNLKDQTITDKYLSLNNVKMQELYKYLEILADYNIKIPSFLKLNISSKGIYADMSDLLYLLFVYVTGSNIEDEIKISLNIDENDDIQMK